MSGFSRLVFDKILYAACLFCAVTGAQAVTLDDGLTFSAALYEDSGGVIIYHSSSTLPFGNPPDKAEVGELSFEIPGSTTTVEVRGMSEFDLTGLANEASVFLSFDVANLGGLFPSPGRTTPANDFPFDGMIDILAYEGNDMEDLGDYNGPVRSSLGSFDTTGLQVGDTLSFDITSAYNQAIDDALVSLGVRLQLAPLTIADGGALTFDNFRLTTDNQTSVVPLPAAVWLFGSAIVGLIGFGRRFRSG